MIRRPPLAVALGILANTGTSPADLVARWSIEEGTGTTTTEQVAGIPGDTLPAGITWNIASTPGPASTASLAATGTNSTFGTNRNPDDLGIAGSGAKTIVAWFKTTSTGNLKFFGWSPTNGSTAGGELRFGVNGGSLRFEVTSGAATNPTLVNDGNWHLAAAIIEANDTISTIDFYLDGNLIPATGNTAQPINTLGTGTGADAFHPNEIFIGSSGNTIGQWNGSIDDVRIYDTALSEAELDAILAEMSVAPPGPLVWNNASSNGMWDFSSANWSDDGATVPYSDGMQARFEDTAGVLEPVTLAGTVAPEKTTFANQATDYRIEGPGTLGGSGNVLLTGGGYTEFRNGGGLNFGTLAIDASSRALVATAGNHGSTSITAGAVLELIDGASLSGPVANAGSVLDSTTTGIVALSGAISGPGTLQKTGASTLVLSANNTYTGNTTVGGGALELTGKLYNAGYNNSAVITVQSDATWRLADFSYAGVGQLADYAARRVIDGGTIEVTGGSHASGQDFTVGFFGGTFRYAPQAVTDTLTLRGNNNSNIVLNGDLTFDAVGNIAVDGTASSTSAVLQGSGGLIKTGAATLTLAGANTYGGNTTVAQGTLVLAPTGRLRFAIGADGESNTLSGTGAAQLAGGFDLDLSGADIAEDHLWTLVDDSALNVTYQESFFLTAFAESDGVHTFTDASGNQWSFREDTGVLAVAPAQGYAGWASSHAPAGTASDDFDNDGVPNAIEYVLGGTSNTRDIARLPTAALSSGNFTFSFTRDQASKTPDAAVVIEVGTDLTSWPQTFTVGHTTAESGNGVTVTDNLDGTDTVTLTLTNAPQAPTFARLKVTVP